MMSSCVWSCLLHSTLLFRNILVISILCLYISWNRKKRTISVFENGKIETLPWKKKASALFHVKSWLIQTFQAVAVCRLPFTVSSHIWLVPKQNTFQKFSLVFMVFQERSQYSLVARWVSRHPCLIYFSFVVL